MLLFREYVDGIMMDEIDDQKASWEIKGPRGIQVGAEGTLFPIQARSEEHCSGAGPLALFQGPGCGTGCIRAPVGCGWRRGILLDEGEVYIESFYLQTLR